MRCNQLVILSLATGLCFAALCESVDNASAAPPPAPGFHIVQTPRTRPAELQGLPPFTSADGYRQELYAIARSNPATRQMSYRVIQKEISSVGEGNNARLTIQCGAQTVLAETLIAEGDTQNLTIPTLDTCPLTLSVGSEPDIEISSESESYAVILRNGSNLYQVLAQKGINVNLHGARPITAALSPYLNLQSGLITLPANRLLVLFETTLNQNHGALEVSDFDYNDIVLLVTLGDPLATTYTIIDRIGPNTGLTDNNNGPPVFHNDYSGDEFLLATKIVPAEDMILGQIRWILMTQSTPVFANWLYRVEVWSSEQALNQNPTTGDIVQHLYIQPAHVGPTLFGVSPYSSYGGKTLDVTLDVSEYRVPLRKYEDYIVGFLVHVVPLAEGSMKVLASDLGGPPDYYVINGTVHPLNFGGGASWAAINIRGLSTSSHVQSASSATAASADGVCKVGSC